MASTGQPPSLKRRDVPVSREGDQLTIIPLGAGNEVGRSCVYMSYKGKTILVCVRGQLLSSFKFHFWAFKCDLILIRYYFALAWDGIYSLTVEFIPLTRVWLHCLTLMRLILQQLISFLSHSMCFFFC